jgi:hypothetical protein
VEMPAINNSAIIYRFTAFMPQLAKYIKINGWPIPSLPSVALIKAFLIISFSPFCSEHYEPDIENSLTSNFKVSSN